VAVLLKNGQVYTDGSFQAVDIFVQEGVIKRIAPGLSEADANASAGELEAVRVIDCQGQHICPGFVDIHVHLREPGFEAKETIETGTQAAARGGFTTVCPMPNTNPVLDSVEKLDRFREVAARGSVRVLPYASITQGLAGSELVDFAALAERGVLAFTDDGVGVQDADTMHRAMLQAAAVGKAIVAHTEENSLIRGGAIHAGKASERLGVPGLLSLTESTQIARDVLLAEHAECHYHVCHVSAKESVRVIRDAKRAGIRVTAEVSPHHLLLDDTALVEADPNFKMNPPLRAAEDRQALIAGLLDGTLDCIATDHAPHTEAEKAQSIEKAPFGIVGSEYAFQLLYTAFVEKGDFTFEQLVAWLTEKPADIFGLASGRIVEGAPADITVVDTHRSYVIDKETFLSKGRNTPFHGREVSADVVLTMVDGEIVYQLEGTDE